ncbi:MAG: DUF126 domain-containing protein [Candidatus Methanosuratincola sp.]
MNGRAIVSGRAEGQAIVSETPFSFFLGVDTDTGIIIEEGHEQIGNSIAGKVLVYPFGKGSSGDCLRLWRCANNGVAPIGIVCRNADSIHAQGAILTNIPMVCNFDEDPLVWIETGDYIQIRGDVITITKKES